MAEGKYDLLLVPTKDKSRIRNQPWYRERLKTKYCRPTTKKDWKPKLVASSWTFIKDGLDDFRDGKPPEVDSTVIIKGSKGLAPNLFGVTSQDRSSPKQRVTKTLDKEDVVFQKQLPQQKKRRERVEELEGNLLDHPLAVYPHLEESVPPDVFEDIVEILDPALNLSEDTIDEFSERLGSRSSLSTDEESNEFIRDEGSTEDFTKEPCSGYDKALDGARRNPYKWMAEQAEVNREEKVKTSKKKQETPAQEKGIEETTKGFTDWVKGLGGETNNIEESTIYSLFASGYETKPALSVPIHVVELTNVPPELRTAAVGPTPPQKEQMKKQTEGGTPYVPSWVKPTKKVTLGAWYLDPKTWKARPKGEPLHDPQDQQGKEMSEAKLRSKDLDKVLASLHGAQAFNDFVERKGSRKPEFLESVTQHQEELAAAEAAKDDEETSKPTTARTESRTSRQRTNTINSRKRIETDISMLNR